MADPDFPDELRSFIQETIPSVDAAELLVLLAAHPERAYSVADATHAMRPTVLNEAAARGFLQQFHTRGLVSIEGEAYRYAPATDELDGLVRRLARVFNERPVTLVRVIYTSRDEKIRSFADAFRLKK